MGSKQEGEARKREFIDTALQLFLERGYENTSIASIIEIMGVTKGAFYHHFESKDQILETITDEYSEQLARNVNLIYEDPALGALEKLNRGFLLAQRIRNENSGVLIPLLPVMNQIENGIFKKKFMEKVVHKIKSSYVRMIYQGVTEGVFNTDFPEEAADLIIHMGSEYRSRIAVLALEKQKSPFYKEEIIQLIDFLQDMLERLLGIPKGQLKIKEGFLPYLS